MTRTNMDIKRSLRKWVAVFIVFASYLIVHEGTHWIYTMHLGVFKQFFFNYVGVGLDIDLERMTDTQWGICALLGSLSTVVVAYILLAFINKIVVLKSVFLRAIGYYITIGFLFADPIYMSILYPYVGGGDMNGIRLLIPEMVARVIFGIILAVNLIIIWKIVYPKYTKAYQMTKKIEQRTVEKDKNAST